MKALACIALNLVLGSVLVTYAQNKKWDYLILSQQWPKAVCILGEEKHHDCYIPSYVKFWVIHGLWPRYRYRKGPFYCKPSIPFKESKIKPIEAELEKYWPNLFTDKQVLSFWAYEWRKHGVCARSLKITGTEYLYFSHALELYQKYNLLNILGKRGIIPVSYTTYKLEDFETAIVSYLGVNPVIVCVKDTENDRFYLYEIMICTNKKLQLIDCPIQKDKAKNGTNTMLYFMPSGANVLKDENYFFCPSEDIYYSPI